MLRTQFPIAGVIAIMFISIISSLDAEDELKVSQIAPAFILKTLDGSEVVRSKNIFSEKELTVLIFWDSYCPDCLETLADCQKFYKNAEKLSVGLCSINFDKEENLSKVRGFLKGEEITFPILSDPLSVTVKKYKAKAYDFSFFIIDKRRIIRHVCYDHPPNVGEVIKKEVEKLLKERLKVSEPAPNFILKTLDESKVVQSKKVFPQKELTVLIFWNSQRKECLDAVAECQKFYKQSEKLNAGVLSVNFDEELTKTKNFVKEKKLTFPILSDIRAVAPKLYKVEDYCFSVFIVDKEGIIRYISYEFPPNIAEVLKNEIEKLRTKDEK
jgi:peroxiredoxin